MDRASAQSAQENHWTYAQSLDWLYGRQRLGIKLGLGKVERLLAAVGDPHKSFRSIHVAGTNGKGSVTRMMANTLHRAGYNVGATTSPHLVSFTERIEVDGHQISQVDVARGLQQLRVAVDALDAAGEPPTFFEVVTALAFVHFANSRVTWAVVETGMGGRLDATNVLLPALTIITNVDLDHQAFLGDTVAEIAFEKAGIMKPGVPCVTAAQGDALVVLKARSREVQSPMSVIGEDYHILPAPDHLVLVRPRGELQYHVGLAGAHQQINAAVVVAATEALRKIGVAIPERALRAAVAKTTHPGRLETFQVDAGTLFGNADHRPVTVLIDGAHNIGAAHALRRHLTTLGWTGFHLVTGFCKDKQWQDAVDQWAPLAAQVWAVPVRNPRTMQPPDLVAHIKPSGIPAQSAANAADGLRKAVAAGADRIVIAGSLFLAGEARAILTGQPLEEIRGTQ